MTVGLTPEQLASFDRDGFLAVPGVLTEADLAPLQAEYVEVLDQAAHILVERGEIDQSYDHLDFEARYFALLSEYPEIYRFLSISLPLLNNGVDPEAYGCHAGPALFGLLKHERILDIVESVIGSEITSNPIQQIRLKPPMSRVPSEVAGYSNIGSTTWHQDHGAAMDDAFSTEMMTVWVAMTDANEDMGCLVAAPGSHRAGELTMHCPGNSVGIAAENYIPQQLVEQRATVRLPVAKGSIIILTKWTEHASIDNVSDRLRWSLDLRYQVTGQPSGRPAFPTFVARSRSNPHSEMVDPEEYARQWEDARQAIISGSHSGAVFEQDRWVRNALNPLCA